MQEDQFCRIKISPTQYQVIITSSIFNIFSIFTYIVTISKFFCYYNKITYLIENDY